MSLQSSVLMHYQRVMNRQTDTSLMAKSCASIADCDKNEIYVCCLNNNCSYHQMEYITCWCNDCGVRL